MHAYRHGWSNGTVTVEVKSCNDTESHLLNCDHQLNPSSCSPLVNGRVRLTSGTTSSEGFIEVYAGNDSWYRICGAFGLKESNMACRQLGYTGIAASAYASFER